MRGCRSTRSHHLFLPLEAGLDGQMNPSVAQDCLSRHAAPVSHSGDIISLEKPQGNLISLSGRQSRSSKIKILKFVTRLSSSNPCKLWQGSVCCLGDTRMPRSLGTVHSSLSYPHYTAKLRHLLRLLQS